MIYVCTINTPLGAATAAATGDSLIGFWFVGQKYYPSSAPNNSASHTSAPNDSASRTSASHTSAPNNSATNNSSSHTSVPSDSASRTSASHNSSSHYNSSHWVQFSEHPIFCSLRIWIDDYFNGNNPSEKLTSLGHHPIALDPQGSPFQKAIWEILLRIPYGCVTTYGTIAKQFAEAACIPSMSAQAIGAAVAHNPISLLIPCHRVIGADGSLTGYAGGVEKKKKLLDLERLRQM